MNTYTQILYHIVFSTKNNEHTLITGNLKGLFQNIWGILEHKKCHLYRINGTSDHIHIASGLHPTIPLSAFIREVKQASTDFIKKQGIFPSFKGWQEGYTALTCSFMQKDLLINYIKNQEEYHQSKNFQEEIMDLLHEQGLTYNEKFLS